MRLYLSSHRLGTAPEELVSLLKGKTRIAVIANAADDVEPTKRRDRVEREHADLRGIGLDPEEVDLREYFSEKSRLKSLLEEFDAVWVLGGNPFVLRTAFHESGADVIVDDRPVATRSPSPVTVPARACLGHSSPCGMTCSTETCRAIPTDS